MAPIYHALVLHLHQPAGHLENLLTHNDQELREILYAIDRIPRALWEYEDIGRVHLALSGTLLETLADPGFQQRVYGIVDCGSLLWYLQNTRIIQLLGTGYYHPVLPLIPPVDWEEQVKRWQGIGRHLFQRERFAGFWPPELGFCLELIPLLKRLGYSYVVVDSEHVEPLSPMRWEEVRYRPHLAQFGGEEIVVIVRDRELSTAQAAGLNVDEFLREVRARTRHCDFVPLVTTACAGENGSWFRNPLPGHNFWSGFYQELLRRVQAGESALRPVFIEDYLAQHGAQGVVNIGPGAWHGSWRYHMNSDRWIESKEQIDAFIQATEMSQAVNAARDNAVSWGCHNAEIYRQLEEAYWRVLRAETSCNFLWGNAGIKRCYQDLHEASARLARVNASLNSQ